MLKGISLSLFQAVAYKLATKLALEAELLGLKQLFSI